jgi:hypothetical protein
MARCEDFPCCGHESGCCPDFDEGKQLNMKCVCGATVPLSSRYSLCERCLDRNMDMYNDMMYNDGMADDDGYEGY